MVLNKNQIDAIREDIKSKKAAGEWPDIVKEETDRGVDTALDGDRKHDTKDSKSNSSDNSSEVGFY